MRKARLTTRDKENIKNQTLMLNQFIMDIMELGYNNSGYIFSKRDGSLITIKGKKLKLFNPSMNPMYNEMGFRPIQNGKLMFVLFDLYISCMEMDQGRRVTSVQYGPAVKKGEKNYIIVSEEGLPDIISGSYYNESFRYIDAICQLNEIPLPLDLVYLDNLIKGIKL